MLQVLVNAVFKIIAFIGGVIMTPMSLLVQAFVPDFANFISSMLNYMTSVFELVPFVIKLLMIPNACVLAVTSIFSSYVIFKIGFAGYKLILKIYRIFKP